MFGFSVLAILALLVAMNTGSGVLRSIASEHWPRASAQIIASTLYENSADVSPRWEPSIVYHYKVGTATFTSDRVRFLMSPMYRREQATRVLDTYHVGRIVSVAYDPANPGESVLEPGPAPDTWEQLLVLLFLVVLSGYIYYEIRNPARRILLRSAPDSTTNNEEPDLPQGA